MIDVGQFVRIKIELTGRHARLLIPAKREVAVGPKILDLVIDRQLRAPDIPFIGRFNVSSPPGAVLRVNWHAIQCYDL